MTLLWALVFIVSLIVLVKSSDWLLRSAEKIGLVLGLSSFVVGVLIVGIGTSLPELISSGVAVFRGVTDVPVANAIGSNIANILLIVGFSAVIGRRLVVTKDLIDLDLPLLAISTVLFLGIVYDGSVTYIEALILLVAYSVYMAYTILHHDELNDMPRIFRGKLGKRFLTVFRSIGHKVKQIEAKDIIFLIIGIVGLVFGAQYLITSLVKLSEILDIATGVITVTAVAFGTSLPELLVSVRAAMQKKSDVALGNIFGSNVFNILVVVGIPALFGTLTVDDKTLAIGIPALAAATLLFIISGISKRIHMWEGALYIGVYIVFIGKLFSLF